MYTGHLKYILLILICTLSFYEQKSAAQDVSFIVLGDLHYDRLDLHDWDYVMTRPQDMNQIMNEYPQHTAVYLPGFLAVIKEQALEYNPPVKAVIQLGDLVEGVAGTPDLSRSMNRGVVDLLYENEMPVPWVLVKGNHDVSNSPGQPEAWREVIRPFMEGQLNIDVDDGMYSYKIAPHTELFVLDQFFSKDRNRTENEMVDWLEDKLERSDSKYKFILTHQPVIPVTGRCWHILSGIRRKVDDPVLRDRFINLIAKHSAIVLCAHLHEYSVLSRMTEEGLVVQVMINSVNQGFDTAPPDSLETDYKGDQFVDEDLDFQPSTEEIRRDILQNEKRYIKYFLRAKMPGYAIVQVLEEKEDVILSFCNGFSKMPYQTLSLSDLQHINP